MNTITSRILPPLALVILALVLASACGRREELPLQEEVDYSLVGDVFSEPAGGPAGMPSPDTVLARVQGQTITQADLQRETAGLLMAVRNRVKPEDMGAEAQRLANTAFQNLVRKALLIDAAEAEDIQVDQAEIAARLDAVKSQVPEGQTWEGMLQAQAIDEEVIREQIASALRVDKLLKAHTPDPEPVSEEEIAALYASNTSSFVQQDLAEFSHILFSVPADASEEAVAEVQQRADRLRAMVGDQVEFEPLAARYSDDESTKTKGGYVGKVMRAQLPPELGDVIFETEPGAVGPVVRSPAGFHIVRVEAIEPSRQLALEEVSMTISNHILRQRTQASIAAYMESLQEDAEIEMMGRVPGGE